MEKGFLSKRHEVDQTRLGKLFQHRQMIAVSASGILILLGWIFSNYEANTLSVSFYILAFVIGGYHKAKEGIEETIQTKKLNVEMLMIGAAIGSGIIGYWTEGAILIFIFALSGALEAYSLNKSRAEIASIMDLQPEEALLIHRGKEERIPIGNLQIKDVILVKPGERIPVDGKIRHGITTIDEASITGESIPVQKEIGSEVYAGTVNINGAVQIEVTKKSKDSLVQKIVQLVQSAQSEKSPAQLFIEKFEGWYVHLVLVAVALTMLLPPYVLDWSWNDSIYRALVLMVVASPCALVASIMPAALSAISHSARQGILVKGSVHLEQIKDIQAIAFDKTGTITKGKPEVTDMYVREDIEQKLFIQIVASIENQSSHPLARAIVDYARQQEIKLLYPERFEDHVGQGVLATILGQEWKIGKAAFVSQTASQALRPETIQDLEQEGKTIIFVADSNGPAGWFALKDTIREESKQAIKKFHQLKIKTVMLTGDRENTARVMAQEAGLSHYIAGCLPTDKVEQIKQLLQKHPSVAMVGDGINDAPSLATASIGIAMGEGSDLAIETADIILMKNDLSKIETAMRLSKRMDRIIKQNICFSLLIISLLITANFFNMITLPFGVIGHEVSTLLVILNGLRLLR